jgi:hypothetical protein
MAAKNTRLDRILNGTDAQTPDYILKMFEAIKGRPPTHKEVAALARGARPRKTQRHRRLHSG